MKKSSGEFVVPFIGLKIGTHNYEFNIHKTFFEGIENTLIDDAEVVISLAFEKKETMMIAQFELKGNVTTTCDRCNDPITIDVKGSYRVIYKFGTGVSEDENLIILDPESYELDFSSILYEIMVISMPPRVLHPEGGCNPEVMKLYHTYIVNANEPDDDMDWDDEDWDEEDWDEDMEMDDWQDDDDDDLDDEDEEDFDEPDNDKPIDPRWSVLKNLN